MSGAAVLASLACNAVTGDPGREVNRHSSGTPPLDAGIDTGLQNDSGPPLEQRTPSPITLENQKEGTSDWAISQPSPNHEIEGYASAVSAAPTEQVTLFVNVPTRHSVHWELYRLGYYGGRGGRAVGAGKPVRTSPQPACPVDPVTGLVECSWTPTFTLTIDPDWLTGQYLVKLVRDDGFESYVPLLVREAVPRAPLLYQSSVNTWQAYNLWGGTSLYTNFLPPEAPYQGAAARVSYDRPYQYERPWNEGHAETEMGAGQLFLAEFYMISWLEKRGYDVAYVTNIDVDASPGLLANRKMFLDVGHDEYWSSVERTALDQARDGGLSLGFFSANSAYWRVRLEPSSRGTARRIVTCYKGGADPEGDTQDTTHQFRGKPFSSPEDMLIGQMYELSASLDAFPLIVGDASHWVYAGTGLATGDTLPHLLGYEWDHVWPGDVPALDIIATSPAINNRGRTGDSNITAYYPTPTSVVFSAGTMEWSWGLGRPGYVDARVQKITENVLSRAGLTPVSELVVTPPPASVDVGDAVDVSLVAGSGVPGYADGPAALAQFNMPAGVAVDASGIVYVTEARNHRIRKITTDGTVSTLAGCGPDDSMNGHFHGGAGTDACFDLPLGIVVAPDGTIYVADSGNHRVRAIDATGNVTTFAGNGRKDTNDDPNPRSAGIEFPRSLALGPDGSLYVTTNGGDLRRIGKDGVTTVLHERLMENSGVSVGSDGSVYVLSTTRGNVSVLKDGALVPLMNPAETVGDLDGASDVAELRPVEGLGVGDHALYVADTGNYKVRRVSLLPDHLVTTFVGNGRHGLGLGTGATTNLVNPRGLAVTPTGILIADSANHRILRAVPPPEPAPQTGTLH